MWKANASTRKHSHDSILVETKNDFRLFWASNSDEPTGKERGQCIYLNNSSTKEQFDCFQTMGAKTILKSRQLTMAPIKTVILLLVANGKLGQHNQDRTTRDGFYCNEDLGDSKRKKSH